MRRFNGFSLMEMMIVLLIVAIIAAASAPMVSKKITKEATEEGCLWSSVLGGKSIYFNKDNSSVIIGDTKTKTFEGPGNVKHTPLLYLADTEQRKSPQISIQDNNSQPLHIFNKNNSIALTSLTPGTKKVYNGSGDIIDYKPQNPNSSVEDFSQVPPSAEEFDPNNSGYVDIDINKIQENTVSIGIDSLAGAPNSVTLGRSAKTAEKTEGSVAIGKSTSIGAGSSNSVAIGVSAIGESSSNSVVIGASAIGKNASDSIAIGVSSIPNSTKGAIAIGGAASKSGSIIIGDGASELPQSASTSSHSSQNQGLEVDLITKKYDYSNGVEVNPDEVKAGNFPDGDYPNFSADVIDIVYENYINAVVKQKLGSTVIGAGATTRGAENPTVLGNSSHADRAGVAIGAISKARDSSVSVGTNAASSYPKGVAIGFSAKSRTPGSIAIGTLAHAGQWYDIKNSIAIGYGAVAAGENSIAIGTGVKSKVDNQIVLGTKDSTVYIPGNLVVGRKVILGAAGGHNTYVTKAGDGLDKPRTVRKQTDDVEFPDDTFEGITITSDRRLKNVGKAFAGGLEELKKLDLFHYTFKKDPTKTPHVGVMAQDLQKVFPDAVMKGDDGFLRIRMEDMFYALVNAVKELALKFDLFDKKVAELEKNNAELQKTVTQLEKDNAELKKAFVELEKRFEKLEKTK